MSTTLGVLPLKLGGNYVPTLGVGYFDTVGTSWNVSALNMVYLRGDAETYVSPIVVAASSSFVVSAGAVLATSFWQMSASNSFKVGAIASNTASLKMAASTSFVVHSAATSGRDLHVSAGNSVHMTAGTNSNRFFYKSASDSFTIHAAAHTPGPQGPTAGSSFTITVMAIGHVVVPWRRSSLSLPPGGNIPHS